MTDLRIYGDDLQEILWFKELDDRLDNVPHSLLSDNPSRNLRELLKYDTPDIILTESNKPLLVLEKSTEVPTGHNMGQRFGRMVRAAEKNVPGVMFFPYLKTKHGDHANPCWANARYFKAMWKIEEIHGVPLWSINWPCDDKYELVRDGSETQLLEELVHELFDKGFSTGNLRVKEKIKEEMREGYERSLEKHPKYESLPGSVEIRDTEILVSEWKEKLEKLNVPPSFIERKETLIYITDMSPSKCRREDPYVGMQFVYDYGWCRRGESTEDKFRNLVIRIPRVSLERWKEANPNDPRNKSSQWYATASAIWLKNAIVFDFDKFKKNYQIDKFGA